MRKGIGDMFSHRQKSILAAVLVLCSTVILISLAEGILHIRQKWVKGGYSVDDTLQLDRKLCIPVPKPNSVFRGVKINSLGFRGPEFANPKPDNVIRLAFFGGSTTYAAEASNNESVWPHLVWKRLQENYPTVKFDYVNAAVPGYGVRDSLLVLKDRVEPLKPDIIIIYHATNDFLANIRILAQEKGIYKSPIPPKKENIISWLSKHSLLYDKSVKVFGLFFKKREAIKHYETKTELKYDPRQRSANFREELRTLIKESQNNARLVAVATFSYKLRREQTIEEKFRNFELISWYAPFLSPDGLLDGYEEYNRVIREVAKETGALLIERELDIPGNDNYFVDTVHFNDNGNKLMAKRVSETLLSSALFQNVIQLKK